MNSYSRNSFKRESVVDLKRIAKVIDEEEPRGTYAFDESEESENSYSLY